jgi:hypothetical protein
MMMMNTPEMPRHRSTSMINRLCCDDSTILQLDIEMRSRRETTKQTELSFVPLPASAKRRDYSPSSWDKQQQQQQQQQQEQQQRGGEPTKKRRCVGLDLLSLDDFSTCYKPLLPKTTNRMATSSSVFHSCMVSDSESDVEETTTPSSPQIGARPQAGTFSTRNNPTNILSLLDAVAAEVLSLP